jgi:hypothetical protein
MLSRISSNKLICFAASNNICILRENLSSLFASPDGDSLQKILYFQRRMISCHPRFFFERKSVLGSFLAMATLWWAAFASPCASTIATHGSEVSNILGTYIPCFFQQVVTESSRPPTTIRVKDKATVLPAHPSSTTQPQVLCADPSS